MNLKDEIAHKVANLPSGSMRRFKGAGVGAEENIEAFLRNQEEIGAKIKSSRASGCHLEELSLVIQIVDFWLRVWFVNTASPPLQRKKEFGALLSQCVSLGFDDELAKKIEAQNGRRVLAIHGYMIGKISYQEFSDIAKELRLLSYDTIIFVINHCGEVVTSFDGSGKKGEMMVDVFGLTHDLTEKKKNA